MSTFNMPGIIPTCPARRSELAVLAKEVVWFALHLSSLLLAGLGMYWSFKMIDAFHNPLVAMELFVALSAILLYLAAAIWLRFLALINHEI
ncbi:hypothetical protein [Pseudomonas amygdali]|uniref:hypothetical protein n=1 Tax=Pseudomonas amygdali TaxID=47877 RepID=UPI0005C7DFBC|nr:hypothetical protein [Pseudomonas amygdali]RMT05846.1 hypothetical protein ALP54_03462 [Pseudomonas amygdali pv. lachrymans]